MRTSEQVQLQLRLPLAAERREQPCSSSSPAHESLRRFARGYVFGSSSRIATPAPALQRHCDPPPQGAFRPVDPQQLAADFASRAAASSHHPSFRDKGARKRADGRRPTALVFGDRAPRLPLSVKSPIERRPLPKRCRDHIGIDALTTMMDNLLGPPSVKRSKTNDASTRLSAHLAHLKLRHPAPSAVPSPTASPASSPTPSSSKQPTPQHHTATDEQRDAPASTPSESESMQRLLDDDTADELSFLVDKCHLNADRNQPFMPYIT
ncbi:hypothetical protein BWQ96_06036 [Gracilariopsis chorda]|uniref:Uncharacterized protein n=1 Tax=Gracilariopsis chorda TaxID=448386 RepID=A0A2V3IQ19_9FLOR|nr:hypothetical protein BWQ96_06036 [Gracilariopsis chorda]|eukprot:PXF44176.1 hypothetical protein BWQ96_06036 [Gracilariopsis chorda]